MRFSRGLVSRVLWEGFINARSEGCILGWSNKVRTRSVEYELKFLIAVLNWAVGARLIASNPWSSEVRRSQGWPTPKELNPHRPSMEDESREGLIIQNDVDLVLFTLA